MASPQVFSDGTGRPFGSAYGAAPVASRSVGENVLPLPRLSTGASVRISDPDGPWAEPSWNRLEEFLVSGYTGSAGGDVPADVRARLQELRTLIDEANPS